MSEFVFTVDVEHAVEATYPGYLREQTGLRDDQHLRKQIHFLLNLAVDHDIHMTFFVLGDVLEVALDAIDEFGSKIFDRIEIAYHSWDHRPLWEVSPEEFRLRARMFSDRVFERTGQRPIGFRAPSWSLRGDVLKWLYPTLAELGFRYSSSEFRFENFLYKPIFGSNTEDHLIPYPGIFEFPVNPARLFGKKIPYNGGIYARFLPLFLLNFFLRREQLHQHKKIFYIHPREVDPTSRRINLPMTLGFLHHFGLSTMPKKLNSLASSYPWTSFRRTMVKEGEAMPCI